VFEIYTSINCFLLISKQQHVCPYVTDGESNFHIKEGLRYYPDPPTLSLLLCKRGALRFKDPEGHTSGSVVIGRVSHPGQGKCDDPDEIG